MELYDEYKQASQEVRKKLIDYLKAFKEKDKIKRQLLKNGQITKQEYNNWRIGQIAIGKRWRELQKTLAKDLHNRNKIAKSIVDGYTPEAYALNHNYATFQVEKGALVDTSYTLYDRQTVERLFRDDPDLLPQLKLNAQKDLSWNRQKIQSVAIQAILQGESIPKIATRLAEAVGDSNYKSAVRNARTMITGAENAGRQNAYNRAQNMGIKLKKTWVATFDGRTRHAHRLLDGQTVDIDKPFVVDGEEIMSPGDPKAKPYLVYNCFVGDTKVASDSELIRSYKYKYEGELIKVKTAGGVDFTCTPNHPILTPNGWVAANRLNKGDDILVTFIGNRSALRRYSDVNHIHPSMEALHNSLKRMGTVSRDAALTVNFHGDIPTSDVEIVRKKRLLRDNFNSCFGNFSDKFFLKNSDSFAFRLSHFVKRFGTIGKSSFSFVSGGRKSLSFFWRRICHSHIHGFGTIPRNDFSLTEYPIDDLAAKSVIGGELLYRLSGKIFLDKIVNVDVSVLNTHVYNLQTKNGYYFTNSIIPHNNKKSNGIFAISKNCRCTTIAQIEGFERDITDPNIRNMDKLKYVSYDQWKADKQHQMKEYVKSRAKPTTFKTRDDADKYLRPLLDKGWGNLTDTEKYGIWKYTENSNPLNKPLSGYEGSWARTSFKGVGQTNWGVEDAWRKIPPEFAQFGHTNGHVDHARAIAAATRAIDKYELQKDMTLVRGSDNYGLAGLFEGNVFSYDTALEILNSGDANLIKEAFVGQTFVNHAFTSTGVAADAGFSGNVSYRIFAPKGTHCLYAEPQSAWGNTVGDEHDPTSVRPRLYEPGTQKNKEEIGWEAEIIVQRGTEYRVTGIAMHGKDIQIDMEIVSQPDYFASGYEQTANNGATKFRHRSR